MPVSGGRWRRSWVKASRPPAEAPTPTMGMVRREGEGVGKGGGRRFRTGMAEDFFVSLLFLRDCAMKYLQPAVLVCLRSALPGGEEQEGKGWDF